MKKINRYLVLILSVCFLFLVACEPKVPTPKPEDWDSKTVETIEPVEETFEATYEYDEFDISMLKIFVTYTDGTSREISVTEEMLSEKDFNKLKSIGTPRITIEYEGEEFTTRVNLIDSARLDQDLNKEGKYACVIKAIRDKEAGCINFIFEPNADYKVCALAFEFTYDESIMQVSNAKVNASLGGIGKVILEGNKIRFAYSEDGTFLSSEVVLFSVSYTGDFRNSSLTLSTGFKNVTYVADMNTYDTKEVTNVLYHVSIK